MSLPLRLYTITLHGVRLLLPLLARGEGKLARGIRGRRDATDRMREWAAEHRDLARPLVWFHAPSVGEGLQARVVAQALRARRPDVQIAFTHFSPSAERFARGVPADVADYLPLDLPGEAREALDALRPSVIAFNKTEVWPNLASEARRRGIRLALLSATLPAGSGRLRRVARPLLRPTFAALDRLAAISPADAERFAALGVSADRRSVMGDARFDQVWRRATTAHRDGPLLAPLREEARLTLVAGSTWPADEERLLAALQAVDAWDGVRALLVPHEPTPEHLRRLEERLDRYGRRHRRFSELEPGASREWEVLVVDRIGVLGELYALADLAYVGGGFGTAGLHSVLEPAAFAAPVLFGPNHANAREAAELIAVGGAFAAEDRGALTTRLELLLKDAGARENAGAAARAYLESGLGAAERGAALLVELIEA